jgi:hypothetical protein
MSVRLVLNPILWTCIVPSTGNVRNNEPPANTVPFPRRSSLDLSRIYGHIMFIQD